MKFGKDIQQYALQGWENDYIDYNALKVILAKTKDEGERGSFRHSVALD